MNQPFHAMAASVAYWQPEPAREWYAEQGWDMLPAIQRGGTDCYIAKDDNSKQAVVSFRGTEPASLLDWLTDLDASKVNFDIDVHGQKVVVGQVHAGFYHSVMRIWDRLWTELEKLFHDGYTVRWTGHSKGAAEALVAALIANFSFEEFRVQSFSPVVFGCPRVFDSKLAAIFDGAYKHSIRWCHNNDIVCRLPLSGIKTNWLRNLVLRAVPFASLFPAGFMHVGKLRYVAANGQVIDDPSANVLAWDRLKGRWLAGRHALTDGARDHGMEHYLAAAERWKP